MTAAQIAASVRAGSTTASAVIAAVFDRIAQQTELLAFTATLNERARTGAERVDAAIAAGRDPGPLAGVPFAAKNLFDVAGVVTRAGAKITAHYPPAVRDADAVAALEAHGAILVGLTNMDEFAYGFVTENAHDGTTRNPHDTQRIAGGSSGGSAAAVAAGIVPLALASDTNGSIRVPAALCGIFGIRPTLGGLSRSGAFPFVGSLDTIGPLAGTAQDLTAAYAALDPGFRRYTGSLPDLRFARLRGYFATGLTAEANAAVTHVCDALASLNDISSAVSLAEVELAEAARARKAAFLITAAEGGELHAARLRAHADDFDPATCDRLAAGALLPAAWYIRAQRFRSWLRARVDEMFARFDVLIAPATPFCATLAGQKTLPIDGVDVDIRPNLGVFTQPLSLAGVPVVSVPVLALGALPLGVQLIGCPGSENMLLALAAELERRGVVGARPAAVPARTAR